MVLFEIPTGVVADTAGRRFSFLLSTVTLMAGTLAYVAIAAAGGGLWQLRDRLARARSRVQLLLGRGRGLGRRRARSDRIRGAARPRLRARLDGLRRGDARRFHRGGVLGSVNLGWPFIVRAALLAAVFVVGWRAMHDIGFTRAITVRQTPAEMKKVLDASVTFGVKSPPVRLLMIVAFFQGRS